MEDSGQHHAPTALSWENNIRLPFNKALGEYHNRSGQSERRKLSCSCRESNHDYLDVKPVALSLYRLCYSSSYYQVNTSEIITVAGFKTRQNIQCSTPETLHQTRIGSEYCLDVFKNTGEDYDDVP